MPFTLSPNVGNLEPLIRYARTMNNPAQNSELTAVMLGAGNRGFDAYGHWALEHPERLKFVGVADTDPAKLERFGATHNIAPEHRFSSWQDLLAAKLALTAFVALPDHLHETAAIATLEAGYHLLLEKPVASTLEGTLRVAKAAGVSDKVLMLGYVLRHTAFFEKLREIVRSGQLGQVITLEWRENVSSIHMSHSFVRGNWRSQATSSPMILAKCSHDLDLLGWVTGKRIAQVSSFGNLEYFRPENAPERAPERCLDGCPVEETCVFHVGKIYLHESTKWPVTTITTDLSLEGRRRALETTNYGRCVYRAGNDVVDNQVASFAFEGGGTGTLTMHGHSSVEGRAIRIDGSKASLRAIFRNDRQEIRIEPHDLEGMTSGRGEVIELDNDADGHGGGDAGLSEAFVQAVLEQTRESTSSILESHLLAFAIEQARLEHRVVNMTAFRTQSAQ
jgi:predicted dehydrogenase